MITPHSSCRYAVGVHWPPADRDADHPPRTFIGAVHAVAPDGAALLVSRVDGPGGDEPATVYGLPVLMDARHLQAMAPNLGEARRMLRAMLTAGGMP